MLTIKENEIIKLHKTGSWPQSHHVFDDTSIWAINAALASERPLLVRGDPGTGKSQLARAAAQVMGRIFISDVVHARSESRDLLWGFDAVARLGEAQVMGVAGKECKDNTLDYLNFLSPGVLWWTFNWECAEKQFKRCRSVMKKPDRPDDWTPDKGAVLLIDEIDKADADLPNGLLETLGNGAFTVPYLDKPVGMKEGMPAPLVVITTNEERELPAAFLRRCLVLHLNLPGEDTALIDWLIERGKVHFGERCTEKVLEEAARQLCKDRKDALAGGVVAPGQAEYLDIVRAVVRLGTNEDEQLKALDKISQFALIKYPGRD